MKNIIITTASLVFIALLSGCSDDGTATGGGVVGDTVMVIGSTYVMSAGGDVTRTSDPSNISIVTDTSTDITTATLVDGNATCSGCTKQ